MRIAGSFVLLVGLGLVAGCGDSQPPAGATTAAPSGKPAAAAATGTGAAAAPVSLDGVVTVAKLVEAVKADAKAVSGKKVTVEGTYWGMWTETSEGKTDYVISIVASKDDKNTKASCWMSEKPKDLPEADNQAHEQAIAITAEGTLQVSSSGKAQLKGCTYKKK